MSEVRLTQPTTKQMPAMGSGGVASPEASQAAATLARYAWRKVRDHLRHALPWIGLCGYLAYGLWLKESPRQVSANPVVADGGEGSPAHVVMRPSLVPATLIGEWIFVGKPHTELKFDDQGTVISRTQFKRDQGSYKVQDDTIEMKFKEVPLFWGGDNPLPDRFVVSDSELVLIATLRTGDVAIAKVYRFKRVADSPLK